MLAAIGCRSSRCPGARRANSVRRGRTASTVACSALITRAATQSPTTGMAARAAAGDRGRAAGFAVEFARFHDQAVLIAMGKSDARQREAGRERGAQFRGRAETFEIHDCDSRSCGGRWDAASGERTTPANRAARSGGARHVHPELDYWTVIGCGIKIA